MNSNLYQISTLKNGIRVVTENIPYVRSVAIGIWVGQVHVMKVKKTVGFLILLSIYYLKVQKRTAKDIAETLESVGGQLNAFTAKEYTCYYARVLDEHVDLALDILADMFFNSMFSEAEMAKEREVIIEEIKMYEDTPDELIHDFFSQTIWPNHPLGRPILGTEESLQSLTRKDIIEFIENHYVPENIVIAVAGKVDHEKIVPALDKLFGNSRKCLQVKNSFPPENQPQIQNLYKDINQVQICLGSPGLSQDDPQIYPLYVLNSVLGGGLSSRLVQEVREERGLAYSVYSYHSSYSDSGLFTFYAGTRPDNYEQVIKLIVEEALKIREKGITEKELIKAKEQLKEVYS